MTAHRTSETANEAMAKVADALVEISACLASGQGAEKLDLVVELTANALGATNADIVIADKRGAEARRLISARREADGEYAVEDWEPCTPIRPDSLRGSVMRSGETAVVVGLDDPRLGPDERSWGGREDARAGIIAPIRYSGVPLGLLGVYESGSDRRFSPAQIAFTEMIANQVAAALGQSQLAHDLVRSADGIRARDDRLAALHSVASALTTEPTIAAALEKCAPQVFAATQSDAMALYVLGPDGADGLDFVYALGAPPELVAAISDAAGMRALIDPVLEQREAKHITDLEGSDVALPVLAGAGAQALSCIPLISGAMTVGLLILASLTPVEPTSGSTGSIDAIAGRFAVMVLREQVLRDNQARAESLAAASAAARALNSTLDPAELVRILIDEIRARVPCDGILFVKHEADASSYRLLGHDGISDEMLAEIESDETERTAQWRLLTGPGETVQIIDARVSETPGAAELAALGVLSIVAIPLHARETHVGSLGLFSRQARAFGRAQVRVLTDMAPHLAVALTNAGLYEDLHRAYQQLQQTQARLVSGERLRILGSIAAGISHDFNNVLAVVLGQTQLAQLEIDDEAVLERLGEIEAAALQGAGTVRRLSDFAGTGGGDAAVETAVAAAAQQALDMTRAKWKDHAEARGIAIRTKLEIEDGLTIFAPPDAIRDALTNLILNAAEAIEESGEIIVRGRASGDRVVLSVVDNGGGMEQADIERALEPFFSTRGPKRLGIGLPVVQTIVARHGGRLVLKSEPGRGTAARVDFPRAGDAPDHKAQASAPRRSGRVLVIEDNDMLRRLLGQILSDAGFTVETFGEGKPAVEACRENSPDVVLTDLGMVEMTGWDVAAEIKRIDPKLPVVLLTGWGHTIDSDEATTRGVDLVMAKPVDSSTLVSVIGQAIAMVPEHSGSRAH